MISNIFYPKKPLNYICNNCDFGTSNKKDYNRHIQTKKHFSNQNGDLAMTITPKNPKCQCSCGKLYVDNSGL